MTHLADTEAAAYQRLIQRCTELQQLGLIDRHHPRFAHKAGAVAEAIEIWRATRHAAGARSRDRPA